MADESEVPIVSENVKMNWPAIIATLVGLIGMGWCFGLLVHPPEAEILYCDEGQTVQTVNREEGGLAVFCNE